MKDDLLTIINHYGLDKQLKYIHSEYFELDEAILRSTKAHITEEIADVMVMLKQFQYFYDISDDVIELVMKNKIARQLKRIENEKSNLWLVMWTYNNWRYVHIDYICIINRSSCNNDFVGGITKNL